MCTQYEVVSEEISCVKKQTWRGEEEFSRTMLVWDLRNFVEAFKRPTRMTEYGRLGRMGCGWNFYWETFKKIRKKTQKVVKLTFTGKAFRGKEPVNLFSSREKHCQTGEVSYLEYFFVGVLSLSWPFPWTDESTTLRGLKSRFCHRNPRSNGKKKSCKWAVKFSVRMWHMANSSDHNFQVTPMFAIGSQTSSSGTWPGQRAVQPSEPWGVSAGQTAESQGIGQ